MLTALSQGLLSKFKLLKVTKVKHKVIFLVFTLNASVLFTILLQMRAEHGLSSSGGRNNTGSLLLQTEQVVEKHRGVNEEKERE